MAGRVHGVASCVVAAAPCPAAAELTRSANRGCPGSDGVRIVNDFNKDGKPNYFEDWTVPLGYDKTLAYMTEQLKPHYTRPDGMPWLEDSAEGELGDRYVDWWWGVTDPELLVRIQEFGEPDETTVSVESRTP